MHEHAVVSIPVADSLIVMLLSKQNILRFKEYKSEDQRFSSDAKDLRSP